LNNELFGGKRNKKHKMEREYGDINVNYKENVSETSSRGFVHAGLQLSEPWFSLISLGLKTIEGRKNKGRFKDMQVGEIIEWTNEDFLKRSILTKITKKAVYKTFEEYLTNEGLDKCLPGIPSLEHGLSVYFKYFTKEDEKEFGVVAIGLELIK
jgi:ASC-1-like (ASCH) protein